MTPPKFTTPINAATATAFLTELADAGLLYHPEDDAADCLHHHNLPDATTQAINRNMRLCFEHLADPCEVALSLLDRQAS